MSELRPGLPPVPERMRGLPLDHRGYPVPWFVAWIDGKPDFRVADARKRHFAIHGNMCWLCGKTLGSYLAFVIGPMCAVNRISTEPPSHLECAKFAAMACPFLVMPKAKRREANMPETVADPAGHMIKRNPGVALVWVTKRYQLVKAPGGQLIKVGEPTSLFWYAEGRTATRAEVMESIESGLPTLREMAEAEGNRAVRALDAEIERAMRLVPA